MSINICCCIKRKCVFIINMLFIYKECGLYIFVVIVCIIFVTICCESVHIFVVVCIMLVIVCINMLLLFVYRESLFHTLG